MNVATVAVGLMYHEVADADVVSGFERPGAMPYRLTPAAFARHLDTVADASARPVVVTDVDLRQPGQHLLLTFDDGGRSARLAADLLARRGWSGHFFVVTARLGTRGFLARSDLREMRSQGHVIGSHSHTHPDIFRDLPPDRMVGEWRTSCAIVEDILGEPCPAASVPGGDSSRAVFASARAAGVRYLFTSEPWLHPRPLDDCWILGRLAIKAAMTAARLRALLELRGWWRERLARELKDVARRSLAPAYRRYVRWSTRGPEP